MSLTNRDLWIDPSETEREGTKLFGHLLLFTLIVIVVVDVMNCPNRGVPNCSVVFGTKGAHAPC